MAVVFSGDEGQTWSKPESVRVEGLPTQRMRPFELLQVGDRRLFRVQSHREALEKIGVQEALDDAEK